MSEFERWEARFAGPEYHFGTEPNAFLKSKADLLKPGQKALSIADGEGRNGVFLAEQGLDVLAMDFSPTALAKSQALARLHHPNVTAVHDVGSIGGDVFVALELVPGETLRAWLDRGPRSWREVLAVFRQAAAGLAAAHAAGLVHRDFKPENVLLDGARAVVTDFGLARALADGELREGRGLLDSSGDARITSTGLVIGTPAYMAPEQFEGKAIDARADQFAFAIALHEALYGERPFPGDSVAALWDSIRHWRMRPPRRRRRVPRWLR